MNNPTPPLPQASLNEIATQWSKVASRARRRPVRITHNGKPSAFMVIRCAEYNKMAEFIAAEIERREDEEAIAIYEARKHEADGPCIPMEDVIAELKRDGKL